ASVAPPALLDSAAGVRFRRAVRMRRAAVSWFACFSVAATVGLLDASSGGATRRPLFAPLARAAEPEVEVLDGRFTATVQPNAPADPGPELQDLIGDGGLEMFNR